MTQTTVIRFHELGGPDVLKYETVPMPEPVPGEIRLRVEVSLSSARMPSSSWWILRISICRYSMRPCRQ